MRQQTCPTCGGTGVVPARGCAAAIRALQADERRDVYEGAHPTNPTIGSGTFHITYSGNVELTVSDVNKLVADGWLVPDAKLPTMLFGRGPKLRS